MLHNNVKPHISTDKSDFFIILLYEFIDN